MIIVKFLTIFSNFISSNRNGDKGVLVLQAQILLDFLFVCLRNVLPKDNYPSSLQATSFRLRWLQFKLIVGTHIWKYSILSMPCKIFTKRNIYYCWLWSLLLLNNRAQICFGYIESHCRFSSPSRRVGKSYPAGHIWEKCVSHHLPWFTVIRLLSN